MKTSDIKLKSMFKLIVCSLFLCGHISVAKTQERKLTGVVVSAVDNRPIGEAIVRLVGQENIAKTDTVGYFELLAPYDSVTMAISSVGYESQLVSLGTLKGNNLLIQLVPSQHTIDEVQIVVNTGYQRVIKERSTGSFSHIDNNLLNRSGSSDIFKRIENLVPGILFNHGDAANTDSFLIRGRSTIAADAQPLIIIDDFPYDGDISNINPDDVESVTLLKDAAAASIWGARAGNGVVVITTKKGTSGKTHVNFASRLMATSRPDLSTSNLISSEARIDLEKFLFENGRYNAAKNPISLTNRTTAIPEAVELMILDPVDLDDRLANMAKHNVLEEIEENMYRPAVNQQYTFNVNGGQDRLQYFFSSGLDHNRTSLVGEHKQRITLRSSNKYLISENLHVDFGLSLSEELSKNGKNDGINTAATSQFSLSPYSQLLDNEGNSLPVYIPRRKGFVDTVGNGYLTDWAYRPLDEIFNERHTSNRRDYLINLGANYKILPGIELMTKYQFQNQQINGEDLFRENSFFARNNYNDFAQIDRTSGEVVYPFPKGAILWRRFVGATSHQGRIQLNIDRSIADKHFVTGLAGFEIRQLNTVTNTFQNIGYNEETGRMVNVVNTDVLYPRNSSTSSSRITVTDYQDEMYDHFISFFSNASYTYDRRYTLSASFRKDEANLFGLNGNQKGTPLWSIGGAWDIGNETFYNVDYLPNLKLRTTYGVNGNIARNASAITTISIGTGGMTHRLPSAMLNTPANRNLSWERVAQLNVGLDLSTKNRRLSAVVEYYAKNATDLLAQSPIDPTYGVSAVYLNIADMAGHGWDIHIRTHNVQKQWSWSSDIIYSYAQSEVKNYHMPIATTGRTYLPITLANPLVGKPLFSVFAFPWHGLDPTTGNPRGMLNGEVSMDYNGIYNSTPLEGLQFFGSAQPLHYGAFRNTFSYKEFEVSFNISYKMGYFFRRRSVDYTSMYANNNGHADYEKRWIKAGDELHTDVPSRVYPAVSARDQFYSYSAILVDPADHIRLEDVNLIYTLRPAGVLKDARILLTASDLGVLWARNKNNIDPYYNGVPTKRSSFLIGAQFNF